MKKVAILLVGLGVVGCGCDQTRSVNHVEVPRIKLASAQEIQPDRLPADQAKLIFNGTEFHVRLLRRQKDQEVIFDLVAHEQTLEIERYLSSSSEFSLIESGAILEGGAESFEPPLPLLRFPLEVPASWDWVGEVRMGTIGNAARASIRVQLDRLSFGGETNETIRSEVELYIEGGGPSAAKRVLSFWFIPGRGLVQREFGMGSRRAPADTPGLASEG